MDSESSNGWCHPPFEHLVAPCKVIQESVLDSEIHTVDSRFHVCGFQIPHPWIPEVAGFHFSKFYFGFRIPLAGFCIPKPWILGSTDQNYLDSRLPYMGQNLGQFIIFLPQIIILSVAGIKIVNNFVVVFLCPL